MRALKLLAAGAAAALALQLGVGLAQVPPTRFFGTVTIDGNPAPPGTEVKAFINSIECGARVTERDGFFVIDADHWDTRTGCGMDDAEVVFVVNGVSAPEKGVFAQGQFKEVNITVTSDGPPPPSLPSIAPTPTEVPPDAAPDAPLPDSGQPAQPAP
jgi:hypothetical protein